ncbi:MAG: hypothetical protein ACRCTZ_12565 [Sarcina sp.]
MFLIVKKSTSVMLCLEASEATLATVYASIKEEYKNLELELEFNKPEMKVFYNIVSFIRELDRVVNYSNDINEEDSKIENLSLDLISTQEKELKEIETEIEKEIKEELEKIETEIEVEEIELTNNIEDLILSDDEIEEPIDFEEKEEVALTQEEVSEQVVKAEEISIEEPLVKEEQKEETIMPKVPNTPGDRMMESLKEQQKNEGLLELEDDKVNTLAYKEHLINYMKLGFATSLLKKKIKESNDTAEQSRLYNFSEKIEKRTDEYELKFKEIGLTTGQVHTFRMEVLRDIRKYQDDSIREICDYINKLYALSENLILNLK